MTKNCTHPILWVISLLLTIPSFITAQQRLECGTKVTPQQVERIKTKFSQFEKFENEFLENKALSRQTLTTIAVKIHIVRKTDGTGGLTQTQLNDAFNTLNGFYSNANMEFFICDGINYINDDNYYDFEASEESNLTSANSVSNMINIYFVNSAKSSSGNNVCGYAYLPSGNDTVIMVNSCALNGSTLPHEIGHYFNLLHTHGGSSNELVDGSNCGTEGDLICDTPADPNLSGKVNSSCNYTGSETDANGDTYNPATQNVMSYSRKSCRLEFSPQQYARIYASFQVDRSYLICPSLNVDFSADNTQTCDTDLTVQFTANTTGATSWEWDVDGDNVIDYTVENPNHRYRTSGNYKVSLTISNGQQTISKVYNDFISLGSSINTPHTENFNTFSTTTQSGWKTNNTNGSSFQWTLKSGATPTSDSGPNTDFSGSGNYIFTEASGSNQGDVAEYISPCISIESSNALLKFAYHMFGANIGELHLDIDTGSGYQNDIMTAITGQQHTAATDAFSIKTVDLSAYIGSIVNLRFRAIRGNGFRGDIALDEIQLEPTLSITKNEVASNLAVIINKNRTQLKLLNNSELNEKYSIHNIYGQTVIRGNLDTDNINISNLKSGIYFITVVSEKRITTKKFIL